MLLGPSSAHTWSVAGEPWLAFPMAFDCDIASLTAASGIVPSAFARWRYIHSSAPSGSGVAAGTTAGTGSDPSPLVTIAAAMTNSVIRAATTAVGAKLLVCIGTCTSPFLGAHCAALPPRRVRLPGDITRATLRRRRYPNRI